MFKKLIIPLIAVTVAVGLAFGTSSFKKDKIEKDNFSTLYFHFIPDDGSEAL